MERFIPLASVRGRRRAWITVPGDEDRVSLFGAVSASNAGKTHLLRSRAVRRNKTFEKGSRNLLRPHKIAAERKARLTLRKRGTQLQGRAADRSTASVPRGCVPPIVDRRTSHDAAPSGVYRRFQRFESAWQSVSPSSLAAHAVTDGYPSLQSSDFSVRFLASRDFRADETPARTGIRRRAVTPQRRCMPTAAGKQLWTAAGETRLLREPSTCPHLSGLQRRSGHRGVFNSCFSG
eukprot:360098-Chlamydomonas_euryale.AAC.2